MREVCEAICDHYYYEFCLHFPTLLQMVVIQYPFPASSLILDLSNGPSVFISSFSSFSFLFPIPICRERKTETDGFSPRPKPVLAREIRPVPCGGTLAKASFHCFPN
ncbi:uncharacterized protein BDW47DRAFT_72229 [Aspergillus candidus]|uniref:Uncharacterized protein n=1 Tax=Aspergillus candidus TaxID=41067 RepID=A0A2I2F234_ASPCN|nr:hypothetical protein BDW47DRAFT_72229 [Aspergillus candidus]PLB34690.1 hypothetical protein BDW47DRAFT_72229 [Aspergillus candidus]